MMSNCFTWFPFGELGEPNINMNLFELQGSRKVVEGVDRDVIKEIVGHEPDFTMEVYGGNPFTPTQLYQGISKVSYSNIRWNRLEVDWKQILG